MRYSNMCHSNTLSFGASSMSQGLRQRDRAALIVVALIAVLTTGIPAGAAPKQDSQQQLRELSKRAEMLTERAKQAKEQHAQRKADLRRADARAERADAVVARAHKRTAALQGQVDRLTESTYKGSETSGYSALLASTSPHSYLERASALDVLATDKHAALRAYGAAQWHADSGRRDARAARSSAKKALDDASRLRKKVGARKKAMDAQIAKVRGRLARLSDHERKQYAGNPDRAESVGGSGKAVKAVNAALSKQGSPYVWGAKGPGSFDCSGLVNWSYAKAGVSVPGATSSQVSYGRGVSESELRPGDVIFYYSSASHDAIYIGHGKAVHAPTEGQDVQVTDYHSIGDVNSVRRFVG